MGVRQLPWEAVRQPRQVLLPMSDEIVEVSLADEERGLGANEAAVVLQLRLCEVAGEDGVDHTLPPLQVLLQLLRVVRLAKHQRALVKEGDLKGKKGLHLTEKSLLPMPCDDVQVNLQNDFDFLMGQIKMSEYLQNFNGL